MTAFWALFLLCAYGCLGGLVYQIRDWFGDSVSTVLVAQLPLLGDLDVAMLITLAVLATAGLVLHSYASRPRVADLLIETETEMRKVTWPTWPETWTGTVAVAVTVVCLLCYLWGCDVVLTYVLTGLMGGR